CLMCSVLLVALILSLVVALAVVASRRYTPSCPDSWVGYQRKCYYFSETEGNWDFSRSQCLALGTSVTGIDSLQELVRFAGKCGHWICLGKEGEGQPWKWVNGTEFNKLFNVTEGADCAYMDSIQVSSSSCLTTKKWICSKPS
uniref:C-type lectin domain-containing protein n=1 Tax=Pelodiscus sinensis TaxID=13735 RepID=K7G448_PELSI